MELSQYLPHADILLIIISALLLLSLASTLFYCARCCHNNNIPFKSFGSNDFQLEVEDPELGDIYIRPPARCTSVTEPRSSFIGPGGVSERVVFEPLPELEKVLSGQLTNGGAASAPGGPVEYQPHPLRPRMHKDHDIQKVAPRSPSVSVSVKRSQLFFVSELAEGWFGPVLHGEATRADGRKSQVVIRMLAEDRSDKWQKAQFLAEAESYKAVSHDGVLKLIGVCCETTPFLIIQEHLDSGDLKYFLVSSRSSLVSLDQRNLLLRWCAQLAAGLHALHSKGYIHHDLAARSCLLSHDLNLKIGDYGFTERKYKEDYMGMQLDSVSMESVPVPVRWAAPDSFVLGEDDHLRLGSVTAPANMWSAGVVLWEIGSLAELPYADLSDREVLTRVVRNRERRPGPPRADFKHSKHIQQLTEQCWAEVNCRLSSSELSGFLEQLYAAHVSEEDFERRWSQYMEDARVSSLQLQNHLEQTQAQAQVQAHVHPEQAAAPAPPESFSPPLDQQFDLNFYSSEEDEEVVMETQISQTRVQQQLQHRRLSPTSSIDSFAALQSGSLFANVSEENRRKSNDSTQAVSSQLDESIGLLPGAASINPVPAVSGLRHTVSQFRGSSEALLMDDDEDVDSPVLRQSLGVNVDRPRSSTTSSVVFSRDLATSFADFDSATTEAPKTHVMSEQLQINQESLCQVIEGDIKAATF